MKIPISVVIIAKNEARIIGRCITAAKFISSDIIVIDSESTDDTVDISKRAGAKVITRPWEGFAVAKNFGNDQAKNDWILSIDADEILSKELVNTIKNLYLEPHIIYMINIKTYLGGKWLRYVIKNPDFKKRLFNKKTTKWGGPKVHESLESTSQTKFVKLSGEVFHYSYETIDDHWRKSDHYARIAANDLFESNKKVSFLKMVFGPSFRFIKTYLFQLGFLDGKEGFQISRNNAAMVSKRYKYLKDLYSSSK